METMYDAIVIGARCGGAPTAMLLARKGYRVLLVDKAGFPSDALSTHFLRIWGLRRLHKWGLLDELKASNAPPIQRWTIDLGDFPLSGMTALSNGLPSGFAARRTVLDEILVNGAVKAGVELRARFAVNEVLMNGHGVEGIRGRGKDGRIVTEKARMVIGADGKHSIVARTVKAPVYRERASGSFQYYSYWSGLDVDGFELYRRPRRLILAYPTSDDRVIVVIGQPHEDFQEFRKDVEGNYLKSLECAPSFAERLRSARREEGIYGTADLSGFFRKSSGPGWVLVGDAGHFKHPVLAFGMSEAFMQAESLAEALDQGFSGRRPLGEALADFERRRDASAMQKFDISYNKAELARDTATPEELQHRAGLRGNQVETEKFLSKVAGTASNGEDDDCVSSLVG